MGIVDPDAVRDFGLAADIEALQRELAAAGSGAAGGIWRLACLERFRVRGQALGDRLRAQLRAVDGAVGQALQAGGRALAPVLFEIARAMRAAAMTADSSEQPAVAREAALGVCFDGFIFCAMSAIPVPAGFWRLAHAIAADAASTFSGRGEADAADHYPSAYRCLLAMALAGPDGLSAREVAWLADYLPNAARALRLSATQLAPLSSCYCIDPEADMPPVALVRASAGSAGRRLHVSAQAMAARLREPIALLERRIEEAEVVGLELEHELAEAVDDGLPVRLSPRERLSLWWRLRERWSLAPARLHPRRWQSRPVRICGGLSSICALASGASEEGRASEAVLLNEGPGGCCVSRVVAAEFTPAVGLVVALRPADGSDWSVYVVRWVRSAQPGQLALGLELLAHAFAPVQLGSPGRQPVMVPALLLAPLGAVRRAPAILAPRGSGVGRRFVLVREEAGLAVAQARMLGPSLPMADAELFGYEIDRYAF
jgi:hypothetical protein